MREVSKRLDQYDFLKGVAIVFVLLLHSLSRDFLWFMHSNYSIGQAVPLFLLCTFILSFYSLSMREVSWGYWFSVNRIRTLFGKILKPFLILQLVLVVLLLFSGNADKVVALIKNAGFGPGSYYPWIYLQFWLLIPFLYGLFQKIGVFYGGIVILVINQLLQYGCSVVGVSEDVYRLLCFRYVFLSVFAYMILKYSMKPIWYVLFFIIGVGYYCFLDMGVKFSPWFYEAWMNQQLPAYFYTIAVFYLLIEIYNKFSRSKFAAAFVLLGKYSWDIFLLQMFVISVISLNRFNIVRNEAFNQILYVVFVFAMTILPILIKDYIKRKR